MSGFVSFAFGELSSDLESVEDAACAAEIEPVGTEALDDLGESASFTAARSSMTGKSILVSASAPGAEPDGGAACCW